MRSLVSGDFHAGDYNTGPIVNGVCDRLNDLAWQVRQMRDYAVRHQVKWLILCGDFFRNRRPSNLHLSMLAEFLYGFRSCGIQVLCITGNHDVYLVEGQAHALSVFKHVHLPGVNIYDEPALETIEGIKFLFFPYTGAPQDARLREAIAKFPGADVLVMHGSVEGSVVAHQCEFEIHDADEVKFETVAPFKLVLSGHLHNGHNTANVWYPGSIERLTFDDEGVEKGFLDVTIEGGQAQVTKVPLEARTLLTLTYDQFPEVIAGALDVKGKVVRVVDVDDQHVASVQRILKEKGCYHVAGVYRQRPESRPVERVDSRKLDTGEFVRQYAKGVDYKGDVEAAVRTVAEMLEAK